MSYALTAETALVLPVEGLSPALLDLRANCDPVARMGVPVHQTALIPFLPVSLIDKDVHLRITKAVSQSSAWTARFSALGTFPGSCHLTPDDPAPFVAVIEALCAAFPETPPYEGQFNEIHPHVTLAAGEALEGTAEQLSQHLPCVGRIDRLVLLQRSGTQWHEAATWQLPQG